MKILSWNYRGLGNPRPAQFLCGLAREKKLYIVFLMETRLKTSKADRIKRKLGMVGCILVDPRGMSEGLCYCGETREQWTY